MQKVDEQFAIDLQSAISLMENDFMYNNHAKYIPMDIAMTHPCHQKFWNLLSAALQSVSDAYSPNETDENVVYSKIPKYAQTCVDILIHDEPAPKGFMRNVLNVARRMYKCVDPTYVYTETNMAKTIQSVQFPSLNHQHY